MGGWVNQETYLKDHIPPLQQVPVLSSISSSSFPAQLHSGRLFKHQVEEEGCVEVVSPGLHPRPYQGYLLYKWVGR